MPDDQQPEQISLFDDFEIVRNFEQGKDELNLAEFPICSLYKVRDPSIKTLYFEDQIEDKALGKKVDRKLTVTASDEFGLPCAFDDEVILALIQLTKLQGYKDRKVYFTKRQILEVLGWDSGGKNTKRVEESLKRWLGVTLTYDQAWRNKEGESWDTEGFHILENVFFKEHQLQSSGRHSYIVWNEIVFRSMKVGNLKSLDFSSFKKLSCPTAKRIFRFLDKRFHHKHSLRFDLSDFAYQKIGIDRRYGPADIKRKLAAGVKELENVGFLKPMTADERYKKVNRRTWNVYFEKGSSSKQSSLPQKEGVSNKLITRMVSLGVNKSRANEFYEKYPEDYLSLKIEQSEYLNAHKETAPVNPGGFLAQSIIKDYEAPVGFKSQVEKDEEKDALEKRKKALAEKVKTREDAERLLRETAEKKEKEEQEMVDNYLAVLTESEKESFIQEAYQEAREAGDTWIDKDGLLGDSSRSSAISDKVIKILGNE